jgi:hypothetical protein
MTNCLFCVNIQGKTNYLFNQPSTVEQIATIRSEILAGKGENYLQQFQTFWSQQIFSTTGNVSCENCFGGALTNAKNMMFFFESGDNENCKYGISARGTKNSLDVNTIEHCNFCYECISGGNHNMKCAFDIACGECENVYYSNYCRACHHCFGCVGLRNQSYCILNKQYTKEEYERLVAQIIEQMQTTGERGEFFHPSLSPFGYNETIANEYLPVEKSDLPTQHGYKWSNYSTDPKLPENAELLHPATIPAEERKALVNDDTILKKVIICEESQRPFTIQKLELAFYRKMGLPLPKLHPDIRHEKRMKQRP